MIDVRKHTLNAVADVAEKKPSIDGVDWYGFNPATQRREEEHSHIANAHLKLIIKDLKAFLEDKKKTTACLKHSTLGILIRTSIS